MGPLLGAALRPTVQTAKNKSYWRGSTSVIKVSCAPVSIDAKLGEPVVESLQAAIAWESVQASIAALKKQDAQALHARVADLESGRAQPKRKSRSL